MRETSTQDDIIDKSKLSQRELLILLSDKVDTMIKNDAKAKDDYIDLLVRVTKVETRMKVIAAAWGVASIVITIIINLLK